MRPSIASRVDGPTSSTSWPFVTATEAAKYRAAWWTGLPCLRSAHGLPEARVRCL